jgi:beta-N-acetylhexosaminidase
MKARKVLERAITIVVGIAAIIFLLNRGGLITLPHAAAFSGSVNARAVQLRDEAETILSTMSLDEKLGQLIVPMSSDMSYDSDMQQMIGQYHIGGYFVISSGNGASLDASQLRAFTAQLQSASQIPLILTTDFEGGSSGWNRIFTAVGGRPSEAEVGATGDPNQAYNKGVVDAQLLASVGINDDFAPVVDVLTNPSNPILQGRTFGSTPGTVITMASKYMDGLAKGGIPGTLKHFPGLGASTTDPHTSLTTVDRTLPEMESVELAPYRSLIASNHAPMIMVTHMLVPSIDPDNVASVSYKTITGLLRQQMGYDGVVVSDALFMQGLTDTLPPEPDYPDKVPEAGLKAFEAGTDLLLGALDASEVGATIQLIKNALASGAVTQAQIDASVTRILTFKLQWKIIPSNSPLLATTPLAHIIPAPLPATAVDLPRPRD